MAMSRYAALLSDPEVDSESDDDENENHGGRYGDRKYDHNYNDDGKGDGDDNGSNDNLCQLRMDEEIVLYAVYGEDFSIHQIAADVTDDGSKKKKKKKKKTKKNNKNETGKLGGEQGPSSSSHASGMVRWNVRVRPPDIEPQRIGCELT